MDLKSKTICRFCLTDNEQEHFFDLFDQIDGSQTLVLKASHVLGLEISVTDNLPRILCSACKDLITAFYEYKNHCKNSDFALKFYLKTGKFPEDFTVELIPKEPAVVKPVEETEREPEVLQEEAIPDDPTIQEEIPEEKVEDERSNSSHSHDIPSDKNHSESESDTPLLNTKRKVTDTLVGPVKKRLRKLPLKNYKFESEESSGSEIDLVKQRKQKRSKIELKKNLKFYYKKIDGCGNLSEKDPKKFGKSYEKRSNVAVKVVVPVISACTWSSKANPESSGSTEGIIEQGNDSRGIDLPPAERELESQTKIEEIEKLGLLPVKSEPLEPEPEEQETLTDTVDPEVIVKHESIEPDPEIPEAVPSSSTTSSKFFIRFLPDDAVMENTQDIPTALQATLEKEGPSKVEAIAALLKGTGLGTPKEAREKSIINSVACPRCPKIFVSEPKLAIHLKKEHGLGNGLLVCQQCNTVFITLRALRIHQRRVHMIKTAFAENKGKAQIENPTYICPKCPSIFENRVALEGHLKDQHTLGLMNCRVCSTTFISEGSLKYHMARAHNLEI